MVFPRLILILVSDNQPSSIKPSHIPEFDRSASVPTLSDLTISISSAKPELVLVRRSTRVRELPHHLQDYHYFSTIMS